jgi:hypothetical protein
MAGKTTRTAGQAARATAGTSAIEVKVTVAERQEEAAMRKLGLDREHGEARRVFFYDTPSLDLLKKGVALRARELPGDRCDSTVKIRPVEPEDVPAKWHKKHGFKVEADAVGPKTIRSASFTVPHHAGEAAEVASGKRPIEKLFNADQESFLREMLPAVGVDFAQLVSLGPVAARCWRIRNDGLPYEIRAEEWRLPDGTDFLELSIKADRAEAAAAAAAFTGFLREIGLDPQPNQRTKTRVALEYFARRA